jgi:hypothetical protein
MNKMRSASSREEVLAWQSKLGDAQRERRREMRTANNIRWGGVVEWPGAGGERLEVRPRSIEEQNRKAKNKVKEMEKEPTESINVNGARKGKRYGGGKKRGHDVG